MKNYIQLIRIKHWIKNGIIFLPLVFGKQLFSLELFLHTLAGMFSFSLMSSTIYIINDIQDKEKDKMHLKKKNRPIASGKISIRQGIVMATLLFAASIVFNFWASENRISSFFVLFTYLLVNMCYSCLGAKNIAILDIVLLVSGFFLRLVYGGIVSEIPISNWLYLTVITGSFFMVLGKRRNEIKCMELGKETREVLRFYSLDFLDKNMYMCMSITIIFYSLWCIDASTVNKGSNTSFVWTIPLVLIMALRYSYDVEKETSDGDPIEVVIKDKIFLLLSLVYVLLIIGIVYWF